MLPMEIKVGLPRHMISLADLPRRSIDNQLVAANVHRQGVQVAERTWAQHCKHHAIHRKYVMISQTMVWSCIQTRGDQFLVQRFGLKSAAQVWCGGVWTDS